MRKPNDVLHVYIAGQHCGLLFEDGHGSLSFEYDSDYAGVPLSLSMPIGLERYGDRIVRPYLMGLLPDEASTRNAIGAARGVSGSNPFRMLKILGLDCPGAVQVGATELSFGETDEDALIEITEREIEEKLEAVRRDASAPWIQEPLSEGHWSLGGCQAKFALREQDGKWFECAGAAATTHILKPGVAGYDNQALVEYLSMTAAKNLGLPVAEVDYRMFGSEPAIVIKRYDRYRLPNGAVARIHQEDFCQALSVSPEAKYAEQGGPSTPLMIELLGKTGIHARMNTYRFILDLFFNYLIGATDAHAKNHSLLFFGSDDIRLAPLYDVASVAPYHGLAPTNRKPLRAALSIGGENRFGMLEKHHIEKMVRDCNLEELSIGPNLLCRQFERMAREVPIAIEVAIEQARDKGIPVGEGVAESLQSEIRQNCKRAEARFA